LEPSSPLPSQVVPAYSLDSSHAIGCLDIGRSSLGLCRYVLSCLGSVSQCEDHKRTTNPGQSKHPNLRERSRPNKLGQPVLFAGFWTKHVIGAVAHLSPPLLAVLGRGGVSAPGLRKSSWTRAPCRLTHLSPSPTPGEGVNFFIFDSSVFETASITWQPGYVWPKRAYGD
jgi:hypothetical protein